MHAYPLVSIITLNYNRSEATNRFLQSTVSLCYPHYEIIVADMASTMGEQPDVTINDHALLLRSPTNLGFAEGNNWAAKQSRGTYIFFVNNDTVLSKDILKELVEPMLNDASIGMTSPKILRLDNGKIEYAGFNKMNFITGRTSSIGFNEKDEGQYDRQYITNGAHGCALMISRELFERSGGFPSQFFLYYEEWDLSERIKRTGYKILFVGSASLLHEGSVSVGTNNPMKEYYLNRNRILFIRRNANNLQRFAFYFYLLLISVPKNILTYIFKRQFNNIRSYLRAVSWNFSHGANR